MSKKLRPIILAGGVGKRLWPLSTESNPKQFIPIFKDLSLFDLTLQRINNNLFKKPIVVTSERYLEQTSKAFERTGLKPSLIILEPESKNTFPAILSAVLSSSNSYINEHFIAMPSDHYISNNKKFYKACKEALKGNQECLSLFGAKPEYPSTEYGYISYKEKENKNIKFIEKPDIKKAKELYSNKRVYWNSGIFVFEKSWFLKKANELDPSTLKQCKKTVEKANKDGNISYLDSTNFSNIQSISFDYGFVEKCKEINMIDLDVGWTDLGSWASLRAFDTNGYQSFYSKDNSLRIERPWGFFQVLMETSSTKVKLIKVMPSQKLSLQKHRHRSETWYVVKGRAKVIRESENFTLELGDSIIIKKKQIHSLENVESFPLEIVEIQTGDYLGEDDIVRLEDKYGRADLH